MTNFEYDLIDEDEARSLQLTAAIAALSRPPALELPGALRGLARDLEAIGQGAGPPTSDLDRAPRLEDWTFVMSTAGLRLAGRTVGHPVLSARLIFTSPVWMLDPCGRWARTLSRFYTLGRPHRATGKTPAGSQRLH